MHTCEFCVVPTAWGRTLYRKSVKEVVEEIRRHGARKLIFVDLNIIADREHAKALFIALMPLRVHWYGLATVLLADDPELLDLCARSGCRGLLMGLESMSPANLKGSRKGFNRPDSYVRVVERLHAHGIALQGCFVFGLDDDRPDVFLDGRVRGRSKDRLAAFCHRHAVPQHALVQTTRSRRTHPHAQLGAL